MWQSKTENFSFFVTEISRFWFSFLKQTVTVHERKGFFTCCCKTFWSVKAWMWHNINECNVKYVLGHRSGPELTQKQREAHILRVFCSELRESPPHALTATASCCSLLISFCSSLQKTPWCPLRRRWRLGVTVWRRMSPSGQRGALCESICVQLWYNGPESPVQCSLNSI